MLSRRKESFTENLYGRLEVVNLGSKLNKIKQRNGVGIGQLVRNGEMLSEPLVHVANGAFYYGDSLVKFDSFVSRGYDIPRGNFISQQIPYDFKPLAPTSFVFGVVWDFSVMYPSCGNGYPNLQDVNKYVDPGSMGWATYILEGLTEGFLLYPKRNKLIGDGGLDIKNDLFNLMPNPMIHSRLVIVENEDDFSIVGESIRKRGCRFIRAELLKKTEQ